MGLFRRKPEFDAELESRVDRLESECRQAKLHCESLPDGPDKQNRLKDGHTLLDRTRLRVGLLRPALRSSAEKPDHG